MMRSNQVEKNFINQFIQNTENTMSTDVSNSIGMVILNLSEIYFVKNTKPEVLFKKCRQQLKQIMEDKNKLGIEDKTVEESIEHSIPFILKKVDEKTDELDRVTLFHYDNNLKKYSETTYVFPLKQVLTLVWLALNDDKQFTHHYDGNEQEKLIQAQKDKPLRLISFFRCLDAIRRDPRCHQGVRNALVSILNRSYKNIELIEDKRAEVFSFLKEQINLKFIDIYRNTLDLKMKRELLLILYQWMSDSNAHNVLEKIDPNQQIFSMLDQFFIKHGLNPAEFALKKIVNEALDALDFSCDPKENPIFAKISAILTAENNQNHSERNQALSKMQNWIKVECDPDNANDQRMINDFYHMLETFDAWEKNKFLINLTGRMTNELQALKLTCDDYFKNCLLHKDFPAVTNDCITTCELLSQVISQCKSDKMSTQIENFFAQWFFHDHQTPPSIELKKLYEFLLDESVQNKILLQEIEIQRFMDLSITNGERELTPYLINRIFLHAILKKPSEWSEPFTTLFQTVFQFVQRNFNQHNNLLSQSLKKDSYSEPLMIQLNYLIKQNQQDTDERPYNMILLPQHVTEVYEWERVVNLLDNKMLEKVYLKFLPIINSVLCKHLIASNYFSMLGKGKACGDILKLIPEAWKKNFIIKNIKVISKYDSNDLHSILILIRESDRIEILNAFKQKTLQKLIINKLDLFYLLKPIPKSHRMDFLKNIEINCLRNAVLKHLNENSAYELSTYLLQFLPETNRVEFLIMLGNDCMQKVIANQSGLAKLLRPHPEFTPMELVSIFGHEWLEKIFTSRYEVSETLDRIRLPHRDEFILHCVGLKNMHKYFKDEKSLDEFLIEHKLNITQRGSVLQKFNDSNEMLAKESINHESQTSKDEKFLLSTSNDSLFSTLAKSRLLTRYTQIEDVRAAYKKFV